MKIWKKAILFYLGGCLYMAVELLWRGWSHGSMFLAGGAAFLLVGQLSRTRPLLPLPLRAVAGALVITTVELGAGLMVNLNYRVWDYRSQPGNFCGQICPLFTLLWIPVALGALLAYDWLENGVEKLAGAA